MHHWSQQCPWATALVTCDSKSPRFKSDVRSNSDAGPPIWHTDAVTSRRRPVSLMARSPTGADEREGFLSVSPTRSIFSPEVEPMHLSTWRDTVPTEVLHQHHASSATISHKTDSDNTTCYFAFSISLSLSHPSVHLNPFFSELLLQPFSSWSA